MRHFAILIAAASLIAVASARAADLPTKAPPLVVPVAACTPSACSGFYAGFNLAGVMTSADVLGSGINGSFAGGGQSIGVQGGYQFANGPWFFGPELQANYVVTGNPNVDGGAPAKYRVGEYVKVGTTLSTLLGLSAPASGFPSIPAKLAAQVISPYLLFGAVQSGIGNGWATGAGVEFALAQSFFLDTRYTYVNYGSASLSPTVVAKTENLVTVGVNYKFGR